MQATISLSRRRPTLCPVSTASTWRSCAPARRSWRQERAGGRTSASRGTSRTCSAARAFPTGSTRGGPSTITTGRPGARCCRGISPNWCDSGGRGQRVLGRLNGVGRGRFILDVLLLILGSFACQQQQCGDKEKRRPGKEGDRDESEDVECGRVAWHRDATNRGLTGDVLQLVMIGGEERAND